MKVNCTFTLFGEYICTINNLSILQPNTIITAVKGEHVSGKANRDVRKVSIANSSVKHFLRGLSNIFTNLKGVSISSSGLRTVSREDLKGL
jgi:hypothetical protein